LEVLQKVVSSPQTTDGIKQSSKA